MPKPSISPTVLGSSAFPVKISGAICGGVSQMAAQSTKLTEAMLNITCFQSKSFGRATPSLGLVLEQGDPDLYTGSDS